MTSAQQKKTKKTAKNKDVTICLSFPFRRQFKGSHRWRYDRQKARLAEKLQNPRLKQIHFHTLRHFFATKLFDQTKSLPQVQEKLGHRNIKSTMVYTHLVEFDEESQNYYHSTAKDEKDP